VKQQLQQATALAATQAKVVDAERQVAIAQFNAQANVRSAEGAAKAKTINADADAQVKTITANADAQVKKTIADADAIMLRTVGQAEATKTKAVGEAEAEVIKLKIASMESGNYAMVQVAEALAKAGVKLVPDIIAGGSGGAGGGTLVDVLLANLIRDSRPARVLTGSDASRT
jgi:regulator of protease activity HflC (stomatin/prohibitin superfamily)